MSDSMLVGLMVPAEVVERATQEGIAEDQRNKRRRSPQHQVKAYVEKLLDAYTSAPLQTAQAPEQIASPPLATVEDAAKIIVECLTPDHRDLLRELARSSQRPLAAYIMSPILLAKDNGQMGVVIGEWVDKRPNETKAPLPSQSKCEYCGGFFTPVKEGQRFCPPPPDESDSCGRKWNMERIRATRPSSRTGDSNAAPNPSQRVTEHSQLMDRLNNVSA